MAGGDGLDLRPGEKMLPTTQTLACHARDAPGDRGRSHIRLTGDGLFRPAQHGFYRAGESDHPPWDRCAGSSHLGNGAAVPTSVSTPGVVARLLSFCAPSPITASGARAAARTRGQASGTTLPAPDA